MQHSAVDLESYARLYIQDRLRDAAQRQRANEIASGDPVLRRFVAHVQAWFRAAPGQDVVQAPAAQPVRLVPAPEKAVSASADPYAGMIVLVRGPKEPCSLDAA